MTNFSGAFTKTGIISIPSNLFDKCTKVTTFNQTFRECSSLQTIPTGLFDNCTKVTDFGGYSSSDYFMGTFSRCSNITGESPYTVINVDGQDVKVHLYERVNYPDYFTAPTRIYNCYSNCSKLTDYSSIPTDWT